MNRSFATSLVLASTALVVFACGGATTSETPSSVCDTSFDAYAAALECNALPLPASEIARLRPTFDAECELNLTLPGTSYTAALLTSCVKAIEAAPCAQYYPECILPAGTLPTGAPCQDDSQCEGTCSITLSTPADGGPPSDTCGTCVAAIAVGQPCSDGASEVCVANASCAASASGSVCEAVSLGTLGSSCADGAHICGAGLVCNQTSSTCDALGAVGAACVDESECSGTLVCAGDKCAVGVAAGAACADPTSCARGLGCDLTSQTCAPLTWVSAGQACGPTALCLVGACNSDGTANGTGTCQTVVAEGQPCPTLASATCDTFLQCVGGVCAVPTATTCN